MSALDPRRSAILFIDFQVDVCGAGGRMVSQDAAVLGRFSAARAAARRVLERARAATDPPLVLHVCHRFATGHPELSRGRLTGMSRVVLERGAFEEGSAGAAFVSELSPGPGEPVLAKTSISPFETTDLAARLARRGVDTVVICGVVTHYAVLGTALAATDRGYRAVVVVDACASGDPARHDLAVEILRPLVEITVSEALSLGPVAGGSA